MVLALAGLLFGLVPFSTPQAEAFASVERCYPIGDGCFFCYSITVWPDGHVTHFSWNTC